MAGSGEKGTDEGMARRLSPQDDMVPRGLRGEEDGGSGMIPKFLVLVVSGEAASP